MVDMKGSIIINAFSTPEESVKCAERLREEFINKGVSCDIVTNGSLLTYLENGGVVTQLKGNDFIVYLDKDKYLSACLENAGLKLFNSHEAVRRCDDKAETYIFLCEKGYSVPKTIFGTLCYSPEKEISLSVIDNVEKALNNYPIIVKESFGSMGKGVYMAKNRDELIEIANKVKLKPHLFQEYLGKKFGVDVRIIVIGGKAVACMERRNENDFRSNVAKGGWVIKTTPPAKFISLAEAVAKEIDLDYCGIDLLYGNNGEPVVCEVNSNAFFIGMEKATGKNVAKLYVEHVINTVKGR